MTDVSIQISNPVLDRISSHRIRWQHTALVMSLLSSLVGTTASYGASLQGKSVLLPVGTTFEGRVDSSIGSNSSHQGDRFIISMATPVLINGSEVAIPAGSQIVGEIVEAIPSGHLPHKKHTPKPYGKLRVQLSLLKLPDGAAYALVAVLAPETYEFQNGKEKQKVSNLGRSVGYVGTEGALDTAASGKSFVHGGVAHVMSRNDFVRDQMYGHEREEREPGSPRIRSMVIKGHDVIIFKGSPVTIKLGAPLKLTMSAMDPALAAPTNRIEGRHFDHDGEGQSDAQSGPFAPGTLPFLRSPQQALPQGGPGPQGNNRMTLPGQQPPPAQSGGSSF